MSEEKVHKLLYIEGTDVFYLTENPTGIYGSSPISSYFFDGVQGEKTYRSDFVSVSKLPEKIEKQTGRYEYVNPVWIRNSNPASDSLQLPETILYTKERHTIDGDDYYHMDEKWILIAGMYNLSFDDRVYEYENIAFELSKANARKGFEFVRTRSHVIYSIEDQVMIHPGLLQEQPCKLSSEESYKIIREHVKREINHYFAAITSDYDFHFTVEKKIPLDEPVAYQVDTNNGNWGQKRKRKPKMVTRYRAERKVKVYEISPLDPRTGKSYGSYPTCPEFTGMNALDLEEKIQEYLKNLMTDINKPLRDCPHCKGMGVTE